MRFFVALMLACIPSAVAAHLAAQTPAPAPAPTRTPASPTTTLTANSTLVLVPALVRTKSGALVFTLKASDFVLTDDGIPQPLHLEEDTGGEPLALVVLIEGGGEGARELVKYAALAPMLESVVGDVPHKIAVVGFDSSPALIQDFTPDLDLAAQRIQDLIADNSGDSGAAILDSLSFSVDLLRKQPAEYRRAILMVTETHDRDSHSALEDALRAISDTNTAIYAIAFSSGGPEIRHQAGKVSQPDQPGPAHGCMSRDPNDPNVDLSKSVGSQAYDCLALLAPPLALAKAAFMAARYGLEKNVPETVAHLTGGEYFTLTNAKSLERDLATISNHLPNRYVLSFQPQSPHPGLHALTLHLPSHTNLTVTARTSYWADAAPSIRPQDAPH